MPCLPRARGDHPHRVTFASGEGTAAATPKRNISMMITNIANPAFGSIDINAMPAMPWGCFTKSGAIAARCPTRKKATEFARRFGYTVGKIA